MELKPLSELYVGLEEGDVDGRLKRIRDALSEAGTDLGGITPANPADLANPDAELKKDALTVLEKVYNMKLAEEEASSS